MEDEWLDSYWEDRISGPPFAEEWEDEFPLHDRLEDFEDDE